MSGAFLTGTFRACSHFELYPCTNRTQLFPTQVTPAIVAIVACTPVTRGYIPRTSPRLISSFETGAEVTLPPEAVKLRDTMKRSAQIGDY